jgi:hypothetical protein
MLAQTSLFTGTQRISTRSSRSPGRMPARQAGDAASAVNGPRTS